MLFHHGCVSVSSSVWKFVCLSVLSCIYCRTSYVVSSHSYKLSYRWTHRHTPKMKQHKTFHNIYRTRHTNIQTFILYESLYVWVSCPVYIVERLMLFHFGCVSVSSSVWKFVYLCVLSCIYCRTSYVVSFWDKLSYRWTHWHTPILKQHKTFDNIYMTRHTIIQSYVVPLWVCISEFICMKVCMIVCLVLYILSNVLCCFNMGVCQWVPLYESLHDCVSCHVYIVERLMLNIRRSTIYTGQDTQSYKLSYRWTHWHTPIMKQHKTFDNIYRTRHTIVLYILSNVLCCSIMGACQWVHLYESLYVCVSCPLYIVERLMLFHYECVSVSYIQDKTHNHTNFHTKELTDTHS
jgi:hypothetical protein